MPPSPSETLDIILHHLLPLLLLSSLSVKVFLGRWQLLRSNLSLLQSSLSKTHLFCTTNANANANAAVIGGNAANNEINNSCNSSNLLLQQLLPNLVATLRNLLSLSDQCRDPSLPSGRLLIQSNLDMAAAALSLHLRDLDLLLKSGVLSSPSAIVLPLPSLSASRDDLSLYVRDLFARLLVGGPDFKINALHSLLRLLRDHPKSAPVVASDGDLPSLLRLLDPNHPSAPTRDLAAASVSLLAQSSHPSRAALFDAGALGPLLRLLHSGPPPSAADPAAAAVDAITADPENAWAVAAYGGVPALVHACRSGSPKTQAHASSSLASVAAVDDIRRSMAEEGAIPSLVDLLLPSSPSAANAAHCLWTLASSGDDFRSAILHHNALPKLLHLLHHPPSPDATEHALRALNALSPSPAAARPLSASPTFLAQLAELIRQGSPPLQQISASLVCTLPLGEEGKRAVVGCMGALVKMLEVPKPAGLQEAAARALVALLAVRVNRKEFVREEKNVLRLVQMLDPKNEGVCKVYPISVAAALSAGAGHGCRKRLVAAGACPHLQVLAEMDVAGAKKLLQRLAGNRLKSIFSKTWRE